MSIPVRGSVAGYLITAIALVLFATFGVELARVALTDAGGGLSLPYRGFLLLAAAPAIACAPVCVFVLARRKVKTGHFLASPDEIVTRRAEACARMGAGKPFWPQARYWLLPGCFLLALGGFGVFLLAFALKIGGCGQAGALTGVLLALVVLLLPVLFIVKTVQRRARTGSFLPTEQEINAARSTSLKSRSLQHRILMAGCYCLIASFWTFAIFGHRYNRHFDMLPPWLLAAFWWLAAVVWVMQIFVPPPANHASSDFVSPVPKTDPHP